MINSPVDAIMYALVGPPTLVCMLMALFGPTYFVLRGAAALKKVPVVKDIPGIKWPSSAAELLLELPGKLWRAGEWMVAKAIAFRNWFQTKFWPWLVAAYHKWWPRLKAGGRFVGRGLLGAGRTLQAAGGRVEWAIRDRYDEWQRRRRMPPPTNPDEEDSWS